MLTLPRAHPPVIIGRPRHVVQHESEGRERKHSVDLGDLGIKDLLVDVAVGRGRGVANHVPEDADGVGALHTEQS
jgi:hypothetical protein